MYQNRYVAFDIVWYSISGARISASVSPVFKGRKQEYLRTHPTQMSIVSPVASECRPAPPSPRYDPCRCKHKCKPDKGHPTPASWCWNAAPTTFHWHATPGCCSRVPLSGRIVAGRRWSPPCIARRMNWSTCSRLCNCGPCPAGLSRIRFAHVLKCTAFARNYSRARNNL